MRVHDAGRLIDVPPATEFHWRAVGEACRDRYNFGRLIWPKGVSLDHWKLEVVQLAWIRHNGLVAMPHLQRLVYMMEKYADGIEYDLRHHLDVSAGELWRGRRWRELLSYIDMLPNDSHKNRMLTSDEEHMEALIRGQKGEAEYRPSMADWDQTASMMAVLIDAVNRNTEVTYAVQAGKKAKPMRIPNFPRPATAAEKVKLQIQKDKHKEMVNLLLPAKREGQVS